MAQVPDTPRVALKRLLAHIPLNEQQLQQADDLIKACSVEDLDFLGLGTPTKPSMPKGLEKLPFVERLAAIQRVIHSLHYNHAPGYLYNVSKDRPFSAILNTAREVLRDALPIKCIEAVFVGLLLTTAWTELDRLPVGFKSRCQGHVYRHIVLAVHHAPSGLWGALGISRRPDLQYKSLQYKSLADLMSDYKRSYEGWGHQLYKIRVGLPVDHDPAYTGPVCWRYCNVSCGRHPWDRCSAILNAFAENIRILANRFKVLGVRPPSRGACEGGGDRDSRSSAQRVALSGTTPEPGATRRPPPPPPPAVNTRHRSVSPTKRRPTNTAAQPNDSAAHRTGGAGRPGCVSAPPRQRPDASPAVSPGAAPRPARSMSHKSPPPRKPSVTGGRFSRVASLTSRASLGNKTSQVPQSTNQTTISGVASLACQQEEPKDASNTATTQGTQDNTTPCPAADTSTPGCMESSTQLATVHIKQQDLVVIDTDGMDDTQRSNSHDQRTDRVSVLQKGSKGEKQGSKSEYESESDVLLAEGDVDSSGSGSMSEGDDTEQP